MEIRLSMKKRYVYVLSALVMLIAGLVLVRGYGTSDASTFGHTSGEVDIVVAGQTQQLDTWLTASVCQKDGSNCPAVKVNCVNRRSNVMTGDAVMWCMAQYPKLVQCSIVDDQAQSTTPTKIGDEKSGGCQGNGACDMSALRGNLGQDAAYLEVVVNDAGTTQGCLQYDNGHGRGAYRIETVCCQ